MTAYPSCNARAAAASFLPAAWACLLVASALAARGDELRIEGVQAVPGPNGSATLTFDIAWEHSWRHGSFHDTAWVFF